MADEILKMRLTIEYMEMGIVPIGHDGAPIWNDVNRILASLPPQEAREMRRKFRKEWRTLVKKSTRHGGKKGRRLGRETGLGEAIPNRNRKLSRKQLVSHETFKRVLAELRK